MSKAEERLIKAEAEISALKKDISTRHRTEQIKYLEGWIHGLKYAIKYANEVSRERAVEFSKWANTIRMTDGEWDKSDEELYNNWIKEQEEKK